MAPLLRRLTWCIFHAYRSRKVAFRRPRYACSDGGYPYQRKASSPYSALLSLAALTCGFGGLTLAFAEPPDGQPGERFCCSPLSSFARKSDSPTDFGSVTSVPHYKYVVCGGGIAAQEAIRVLVKEDPSATLLAVALEWRSISRGESGFQALPEVLWASKSRKLVIGEAIVDIDPRSKLVRTSSGASFRFDRCLVAVGVQMEPIPEASVMASKAKSFVAQANLECDWNRVEKLISDKLAQSAEGSTAPHITIVGGGWIACRVASELLRKGSDLTFTFAEPVILARYLPRYLSDEILARFQHRNVDVDSVPYSGVRFIMNRIGNDGLAEAEVTTSRVFDAYLLETFRTDLVLFAPTEMEMNPVRDSSGSLEIDGGAISTNAELSAASDVYAAGSCVSYPVARIGGRRTSWSEIHAVLSGRHAAYNMLGARDVYSYVPPLIVDLKAIGLEVQIIGEVSSAAETFGFFSQVPHRERHLRSSGGAIGNGIVFFTKPTGAPSSSSKSNLRITGVLIFYGDSSDRTYFSLSSQQLILNLLLREPAARATLEKEFEALALKLIGSNPPLAKRHRLPRPVPVPAYETLWIGDEHLGSRHTNTRRREEAQRNVPGGERAAPKSHEGLNSLRSIPAHVR